MATEPPHRGELIEGPDKRGRYTYCLWWMADYHPGHPEGEHGWRERCQCFFAKLPDNPNITWEDKRNGVKKNGGDKMRWINDFKLEIQVPPPGYAHDRCTASGVTLAQRAAEQVGAKRCVVCNDLIDPTVAPARKPAARRLVDQYGFREKPKQTRKPKMAKTRGSVSHEGLEHALKEVMHDETRIRHGKAPPLPPV